VVKICVDCHYVNAGGYRCCECDGRLIMVTDAEAQDLPPEVWKTQRVDYGARRGMIMRFMAIFIGAVVGLYGFRESFAHEGATFWLVAIGSIVGGLTVWWILHRAATRGVRVWVLAKGKVNHKRLARAIFVSMIPWMGRRNRAARRRKRRLESAEA
jgi:hypothetical protein